MTADMKLVCCSKDGQSAIKPFLAERDGEESGCNIIFDLSVTLRPVLSGWRRSTITTQYLYRTVR